MKEIEEVEEIMDDEPKPILTKDEMTVSEVCENIETILRNQYSEQPLLDNIISPPAVYISTLKLNPRETNNTVHRYSVGAFKIGEGDLEDLFINKDTGIPETKRDLTDCLYFLTVVESGVINTEEDLLNILFNETKEIMQHSEKAVELKKTKKFIDTELGLANMQLTLER